ncbi:MAG: hydroxymethylglutaryl-CoA lyase [Acidimicrobiales bacterium]|nr:hydroxymethylglutaryl-CoA lyase [Acidimicrobiales bacterium]
MHSRPVLPHSVTIRDVGPRDGLQPEAPVPVERRIELVESLIAAGVSRIEAVAFVSPKAVPAMAGAAEVLDGITRSEAVTIAALVPNLRGAEMALESEVDELTVTLSFSETYNQRNVKMSVAESESAIADIVRSAAAAGVPVDAVVSCSFGSPYEGDADPAEVVALAQRLLDGGTTTVTYADTTGMATPRRIHDLADALDSAGLLGPSTGLHLHDTRGTALANAFTALERGISRFDTAVGGLGGSPFAHGAGGNLATEVLVAALDDAGVSTGIEIERLVDAALLVEELVGRPVPSGVAHQGPRTRRSAPQG